ncbi:MAG: T9SS type A sorting domain-containing protein, partial [Bacteroidales bacterium]|nr:T9SS type A sorting domain-containing protein [Bacteroidales bacterium]
FEFYVVAFNDETESEPSEVYTVVVKGDAIEEMNASFNIYPNPVSDGLVIETEANIEAVTIYTVTGGVVYSEVDYNNNTIDVSDFANGVYIMKVRTENGEAVQRFIKK